MGELAEASHACFVAGDDEAMTDENTSVTTDDVLTNDTDVDGDALGAGVLHTDISNPRSGTPQMPLVQSRGPKCLMHPSPGPHGGHEPPPQFRPVSSPFFFPSSQSAAVGLSVGALVGAGVGAGDGRFVGAGVGNAVG